MGLNQVKLPELQQPIPNFKEGKLITSQNFV
jgi:hypothetical protein